MREILLQVVINFKKYILVKFSHYYILMQKTFSGILGGLVGITAGCGIVSNAAAAFIGGGLLLQKCNFRKEGKFPVFIGIQMGNPF